jgi:hypothetical protein
MFGEGDALRRGIQGADMGHDAAGVEFDLELVRRLARFHAAPDPSNRNRVANRVLALRRRLRVRSPCSGRRTLITAPSL